MAIEHKNITDAERHAPKGASTASTGQVPISDGAGDVVWGVSPIDGIASALVGEVYRADGVGGGGWSDLLADIQIERMIDGKSLAVSQVPAGLGEANSIQIEFGAAINTGSDPIQLLADGTLRVNEAGTYRLKLTLVFGRTGGAGVSEVRFRVLVNGTQAGQTIGAKISDSDSDLVFTDEAWVTFPGAADVTYEMMRDSSGNDSGQLDQPVVTAGTAPDWNSTTCAALRAERWT